jgi:hypothetical protein
MLEALDRKIQKLTEAVENGRQNRCDTEGDATAAGTRATAGAEEGAAKTSANVEQMETLPIPLEQTSSESNSSDRCRVLKRLLENLSKLIGNGGEASTIIEHCQIFEGLTEEELADLWTAAGIPDPDAHPDPAAIAEARARFEMALVERVLNVSPAAWDDDRQFRVFFLILVGAEHEQRLSRDTNTALWERVFEYRRLSILNRQSRNDETPTDADMAEFMVERPVRESPPRTFSEARQALMADHFRVMRNAEEVIGRAQRAITRAEETIQRERGALVTLRQEDERAEMDRELVEVEGRAIGEEDLGSATPKRANPGGEASASKRRRLDAE